MKSFCVVLMLCIMGIASSVSAKKDTSPPWAKMAPAEKAKYEKDFKCGEASTVMKLVVQWPKSDVSEVDETGMYTAIFTLDDVTSAIVGYKSVKDGKDIPIISMVKVGDVSVLAVEFNYVKYSQDLLDTGKSLDDMNMEDGTKNSTGEYFCYIN